MYTEYSHTFRAMGTDVSLAIVCSDETTAHDLLKKAASNIAAYEQRFSRFLPQSELSLLNAQKSMRVSKEFLDVIQTARTLFIKTHGAFNPLMQISRMGYASSFETLKTTKNSSIPVSDAYNIDFASTYIDATAGYITLLEGQQLDVGGLLKGYLAERVAKEIHSHSEVHGSIVNIGGDLYTCGRDAEDQPFLFSIYNPVTDLEGHSFPLQNESLATSGTYKRTWEHDLKPVHHILAVDGTRNPETDIVSASVTHAHGAYAEAYTKVLLSLGEKKARDIFTNEHLTYTLIKKDGSTTYHTQ